MRGPTRAAASHRRLVLIELAGGNDGLSTVVPFENDDYHRQRPTLRRDKQDLLRLDDQRGLHPALLSFQRLYKSGRLAIVEGVGYPDPVRSHFKSFEIWHAAHARGRGAGEGWIGRLGRALWPELSSPELVLHLGSASPYSLHSRAHPPLVFETPAYYRWLEGAEASATSAPARTGEPSPEAGREAVLAELRATAALAQQSSKRIRRTASEYRTPVEYPRGGFAAHLRNAAAILHSKLDTRVISTRIGSFDTHSGQQKTHDDLMQQLDEGLSAFMADLRRSQAGRDTMVLAFSEFGRRVSENASGGTDHGKAGPLFVLGHSIEGGLYGRHPQLDRLDDGDLAFTTDFRSVYATVIERWFGADAHAVLGADFEPLTFA